MLLCFNITLGSERTGCECGILGILLSPDHPFHSFHSNGKASFYVEEIAFPSQFSLYRGPGNGLYVVARIFFLLLLNCSY